MGSFHICNEDIGGPQLTIDITNNSGPYAIPDVLESYRDVCTCINVPQYVQNMTEWSINNYGNEFLAYYQLNCSETKWNAVHVPAGRWCYISRCMHLFEKTDSVTKTTYKIQSLGPDPNSKYFKTSCTQKPINSGTMDSVRIENQNKSVSGTDLLNVQQNSASIATKNDQLEKRIDFLSTEIQALKNKTVELESNQKNHYKNWEDWIKKLKDDFEIFA